MYYCYHPPFLFQSPSACLSLFRQPWITLPIPRLPIAVPSCAAHVTATTNIQRPTGNPDRGDTRVPCGHQHHHGVAAQVLVVCCCVGGAGGGRHTLFQNGLSVRVCRSRKSARDGSQGFRVDARVHPARWGPEELAFSSPLPLLVAFVCFVVPCAKTCLYFSGLHPPIQRRSSVLEALFLADAHTVDLPWPDNDGDKMWNHSRLALTIGRLVY